MLIAVNTVTVDYSSECSNSFCTSDTNAESPWLILIHSYSV